MLRQAHPKMMMEWMLLVRIFFRHFTTHWHYIQVPLVCASCQIPVLKFSNKSDKLMSSNILTNLIWSFYFCTNYYAGRWYEIRSSFAIFSKKFMDHERKRMTIGHNRQLSYCGDPYKRVNRPMHKTSSFFLYVPVWSWGWNCT